MSVKRNCSRQMFTKEEDTRLKNIVKEYLKNNKHIIWEDISNLMITKNARQCKDRWIYYLDDNIDRSPFTPQENYMLLWSIAQVGKKWTQISSLFPKRTDVLIKSQYKKLLRRNATLENVFEISNAKYYKPPKEGSQQAFTDEEFTPNDDMFASFEFDFDL